MNMEMLAHAGLLMAGVFISAVSQTMLKKAAVRQRDSILQEYLNPLVMAAYVLFAGSTVLSVSAYRKVPLSMGPVLEAAGYVYVTFFGVKIFHEKISTRRASALVLIVFGIVVYSVFG